jgi:hypothetical protein
MFALPKNTSTTTTRVRRSRCLVAHSCWNFAVDTSVNYLNEVALSTEHHSLLTLPPAGNGFHC